MSKALFRPRWPVVATLIVLAAIAGAAYFVVRTIPPRTIVMATGAEGGAYFEVGKRYRDLLAREGIDVKLVPTGGAIENLALMRNRSSGVSVGLVQGGLVTESAAPELESLGTIFYEPLWLFRRRELRGGLDSLVGRKIAIGPEGSGTRALALELLKRNGLDRQVGELLPLGAAAAADKLVSGEVDGALMLVAFDSPVIRRLIVDEHVTVASFPNTDAYVALYPFLNKVIVPEGVGDLATNRPPADVALMAPKASLVVRKDLHSALKYLLLTAAVQVHSAPGVFNRAGQFPAAEGIDLPLSADAQQFYKSGRPFLQNYLPFWAASLAGRLAIVAIPLLGILFPLMRFLPALYSWRMRSKISRLYGELRFLEDEMEASGPKRDTASLLARLDRLELQANHVKLPLGFANMLYMLRDHIALVRQRLKAV
jgi:TRAP transporter TAXI family solute receptor